MSEVTSNPGHNQEDTRPVIGPLEWARQAGYDDGYDDGRQVVLESISSSARPLAALEIARAAVRDGDARTQHELGIEWTKEGMTLHRPAWCDTETKWADYHRQMTDWWATFWDGFTVANEVLRGRGERAYLPAVAERIAEVVKARDPLTVDELGAIAGVLGCPVADLLPAHIKQAVTA